MDVVINGFSALSTSTVAVAQRLGVLAIPVVIAIAAVINYFGGEKAIRAVGIAIAMDIRTIVVNPHIRDTPFMYLGNVLCVDTVAEAMTYIDKIAAGG